MPPPTPPQGYSYSPIRIPTENTPLNENKFKWNNWDCVNKLFPNVSINHNEPTSSASLGQPPRINGNKYLKAPDVKNDFIACALLDRGKGNNDKIYFKSEVVVKGEDYGWVMGNGLSTKKDSSQTIKFEYRLLLFKKEGSTWKVDRGFGWDNSVPTNSSSDSQFTLEPPEGSKGSNQGLNGNSEYSSRQVGSGMARVEGDGDTKATNGQHLIESLKIYMNDTQYPNHPSNKAEFFGDNGRGQASDQDDVGYHKVNRYYDPSNNSGWKTLSSGIKLADSLADGYAPFKNKSIKGMSLAEGCSHGFQNRDKSPAEALNYIDEAIRDMCFIKTGSSS